MRRMHTAGWTAAVGAVLVLAGGPGVSALEPQQQEVALTITSRRPAPLVDAARTGDREAFATLLRQGVDVNLPAPDGATALHWAAQRDDVEMVDRLVKAGANVSLTNRLGVAPLSLAAINGNAAVIERLLKAGADANTTMSGEETVLMTAARTGKVEPIQALIAAGADVNRKVGATGQTALMWAASRDNADAVRVLIAAGADINARTARPAPPAPRQSAATSAAAALVTNFEGGRSMFSAPPPTGFTPFLFAVRSGSLDAVRALLDAGADVNDALSDGTSALILAIANTHWQLADLLLDHGADPNVDKPGWNALHQAVRIRRPNIGFGTPGPIPTGTIDSIIVIKKLIAKGVNVNARMHKNGMKDGQRNRLNRLGASPFLLAAKNTDVEVMKVLLAAGADPKVPTADGTTPLMVAAGLAIWNPGEDGGSLPGQEDEVLEAVKICVENGNDVNAQNQMGETALHGVAFRGVNQVAQYLVDQGARLDTRDTRGWSALAIARGLSYSDFFKQQVHTARLLEQLMQARGLSIDGQAVDPKVCFDCLQTHADQQRAVTERDRKMEAEWAARAQPSQQP